MASAADLEQMLEDVKTELDDATQRSDIETGDFVLEADIQRIWRKPGRLSKLFPFGWALKNDGNTLEFIRINLLKVVSILVAIHWRDWPNFDTIFINQPSHRLDKDLPFTSLSELRQASFLRTFGKEFYEKQWTFLPIVIEAGKAERHPRERRLPFVHSKYINRGGSATVYKETIAAGYFSFLNGKNDSAFEIARKVVYTQDRFTIETGNLNQLRGCLSSHRRIMINLATIIHDTEHGTTFNILYDLACFDLNEYLHDLPAYQEYMRKNPSHFSSFKEIDFVQEASILADALHFLHHGLWDGSKIGCVHNDLKPDNILVVWWPDRRHPDELISPVGKWKIADFGISRIKQAKDREPEEHGFSASSQYLAPIPPRDLITRFSPDTTRRPPGAYSAPEIEKEGALLEDGRKSDIWSYGCVLALVLAFALGGSAMVKEFEKQQFQHTVHTHSRFYQNTNGEVVLKSSIRDWLLGLAHRFPERATWVSPYVNLVLRMLMINFTDRPSAGEVRDELSRIFRSTGSPSQVGLGISVTRLDRERGGLRATQIHQNRAEPDSELLQISFPVPAIPHQHAPLGEADLTDMHSTNKENSSVLGAEQAGQGASNTYAGGSPGLGQASYAGGFSLPLASPPPFGQSRADSSPVLDSSQFERMTPSDSARIAISRDPFPQVRRDSGLDVNSPIANRFSPPIGASMPQSSPPLEHSQSSSLQHSSHTSSASDPLHLRPTPLDERSTFAKIGFEKVGGKNHSADHCAVSPDGDIGVTWNKRHAIVHCLPKLDLKVPGETDSWYPKSPKVDDLGQEILPVEKGWQIESISIAGSFKTNTKVFIACHTTKDERNMVSIYKVHPTPLGFYKSEPESIDRNLRRMLEMRISDKGEVAICFIDRVYIYKEGFYDASPISLAGFPIDANVWQSIAFTSVTLWLFGWAARKDMWKAWDTSLITASKREPIFTDSKPVRDADSGGERTFFLTPFSHSSGHSVVVSYSELGRVALLEDNSLSKETESVGSQIVAAAPTPSGNLMIFIRRWKWHNDEMYTAAIKRQRNGALQVEKPIKLCDIRKNFPPGCSLAVVEPEPGTIYALLAHPNGWIERIQIF